MTETHIVISCPACGTIYAEMDSSVLGPEDTSQYFPCKKCSQETGHVSIKLPPIEATVSVGMRAKGRQQGIKKPVIEARAEPSVARSTGKRVFHERTIDRKFDHYSEKVTDRETGEVIHQCDEPLSEHRGHGSAKRKGSKNGT